MLAPLNPLRDLRLSGQVIYTGRSSMEVAVKMEAVGPESGSSEELADQTVLIGLSSYANYYLNSHPGASSPGAYLDVTSSALGADSCTLDFRSLLSYMRQKGLTS